MSIRDEPPRCCKCKKVKPDVRWDPGLRMALCGGCWFTTPPPDSTPPTDRCKGK